MSRTMVKNGSHVQRAIHELSAGQGYLGSNRYCFVREVAENAGCSKNTAVKYLQILADYGIVELLKMDGFARLYVWKGK